MDFQVGDPVMHWSYGLGQIAGLEERTIAGGKTRYYAVKVRDLTVWVPDDDHLGNRLRYPTSMQEFDALLEVFSRPGDPLTPDQYDRKQQLEQRLKDGQAASLCGVIRDLHIFSLSHSLNYHDQNVQKRVSEAFAGEWAHVHSISMLDAEAKLRHLLGSRPGGEKTKK